jgi:hypothetical protein
MRAITITILLAASEAPGTELHHSSRSKSIRSFYPQYTLLPAPPHWPRILLHYSVIHAHIHAHVQNWDLGLLPLLLILHLLVLCILLLVSELRLLLGREHPVRLLLLPVGWILLLLLLLLLLEDLLR